ncbi:hypothetical protein [Chengkuizengella axinellae]|uniref:Lipoprotein n=1 Tax=Chengkuizengella axinellae TaxID=3064388 RepID=A0ABT9J152_9BACL|nr:hypothetical protein [Chengkuizengella sp. 2205SS18-9]MDP5275356.1 hypothetical protein [Chengkuizengella sp. 2205SS18-9]
MKTAKLTMNVLLLLLITLVVIGCSNKQETLLEVHGTDFTYSEYFKDVDLLDKRKSGAYYQPLPFEDMMSYIPDSMKNNINLIDKQNIPFEINEETAYLVTSKDIDGKLQHQVQYTYLHNSSYGRPKEFLIISVTEIDENPLAKYDSSKEKHDIFGNEIIKADLINGYPIFHKVTSTNGGLVYKYYGYNKEENRVSITVTSANELYSYYNGHVYHVGYLINGNKYNKEIQEQILALTRDFILGENNKENLTFSGSF